MNIRRTAIPLFLGFFLLAPGAALSDNFSFVVQPDTQMYSERYPAILEAQMQWIVDNQITENIIYVAHLGDLKDDATCDTKLIAMPTGGPRTEWEIVDQAFDMLETATSTAQPDGIPFGTVAGNHDFDQVGSLCPNFSTQRPLATYDSLFGPSRFTGRAYFGGSRPPVAPSTVPTGDNFTLFEASGVKFIAINLAYRQDANPDDESGIDNSPELTWADDLLTTYSDRIGIVTSHYFMDCNNVIGNCASGEPLNNNGTYGSQVYDRLSNNANLFVMMSAHEYGEAYRRETRTGMQPVHILLSDYQRVAYPISSATPAGHSSRTNPGTFSSLNGLSTFGNSGLMRILRFDTDTGMMNINTFSPPMPAAPAVAGDATAIPEIHGTSGVPERLYLPSTYTPTITGDPLLDDGLHIGTASNLGFSFTGYAVSSDTTPDAFSFTDQVNVATSTSITSNTITVSGIDAAADISVSGGQYSVNGGAFTSAAGSVNNGQTVQIRLTSSASSSTTVSATVIIGGVDDDFSVTTAAPTPTNPTSVDQARWTGSTYLYGSAVTPNVAIFGAPVDTDFSRWAIMHDKGSGVGTSNIARLYIMRQGSNTQLYQFGFNSGTGRYEYGFDSIPILNITGAPADANPGSIAMLHDNSSFRLYMRSSTSSAILYQFIFNGSTYAYVNPLTVSGFPANADWNGWGMLYDGGTYRLYVHNPIASDSMYQAALVGSTFVYAGAASIPVLSITGMPAGAVRPDFGMLHDGTSFRFNYLR